jgi:hypothetical protein
MKAWESLKDSLARLAITVAAVALNAPTVHGAVGDLANKIASAVEGFQTLLLVIATSVLGAGIAIRFLPTGSHRTKEFGGSLIDAALIIAALATVGVWILYFAGDWVKTVTGYGEIPQPSNPWKIG